MVEPIPVWAGGCSWLVQPEWRERLFGPDGLRLEEWLRSGAARPIKQGPHRIVYRVTLPGLDCHIKHNRIMDLRAWMRELVRPAKALIEYHRARTLAERGVPTIVPVAVGSRTSRAPGESFLVTLSLQGAVPLMDVLLNDLPTWDRHEQTRFRQRLATALGEFIARVHHAGVLHRDLHLGNLLFRNSKDCTPELFLIDLHSARLGAPLDWPSARNNLAVFSRLFTLRASPSDRLRFWHSYARCRWPDLPPRLLAERGREVERHSKISLDSFWRHRDRRCVAANRYFQKLRSAAAAGFALTDIDPPVLDAFLADPDATFRQPGVKLLKDSRSSTVAELELAVAGVKRTVIYKRFRVTAASDPWLAWLRQPAALRSWNAGHALRDRGLPTPCPLLVLHRRRHGLYREGYLLTEKVADAVDLREALRRLQSLPTAVCRSRLRCLIDQTARLIRDLHDRQIGHRDLKAANILVQLDPGAPVGPPLGPRFVRGAGPLWLVDLVGVSRQRRLSRARRVQNLARLHASFSSHADLTRSDKLRFLRIYLRWGVRGHAGWKRWWQQIEQATLAKMAQNARRGRALS